MSKSTSELLSAVESLQAEVQTLTQRLSRLEGAQSEAAKSSPSEPGNGSLQLNGKTKAAAENGVETAAASTTRPASIPSEPIPEDILLVIAAAAAAFLGERPHIRQIRLIGSHLWATQGRVTIQASHRLHH